MKYVCLSALCGLIACAPVPDSGAIDDNSAGVEQSVDGEDVADNPNDLCDAGEYRALIGTPVTATVFPTGKLLRVFSEADIVTQEYIPQRTNVMFSTGGQIMRVFCG
ncbi:MAG: I78 family peptidase inhibitor [Paracoccaceae bacterium]